MMIATYSLKMYLFQDQYRIQPRTSAGVSYTASVLRHIRRVPLFVVTTYVKYWYTSNSGKILVRGGPEERLGVLQGIARVPRSRSFPCDQHRLLQTSLVPLGSPRPTEPLQRGDSCCIETGHGGSHERRGRTSPPTINGSRPHESLITEKLFYPLKSK